MSTLSPHGQVKKGMVHSYSSTDIKKYNREYYKKNRERILAGMYEKVECKICKRQISKCNLPRHERGNKHLANKLKSREDDIDYKVKMAIKKYLKNNHERG
jgi:hypothetical protein